VIAALNSHPAIGASVVIGVGGGDGDSSADAQLVAYVVATESSAHGASDGERPGVEELRRFVGGSLPAHMVPSKYIWLDRLPLTAHGKVDRRALPSPAGATTGGSDAAVGTGGARQPTGERPRTETEAIIASVLAELLEIDDVGMDQNFFLLGGHSMLGAQLIVRLEKLFDVEITLRYLFDHPTLAGITAEVETQMAAGQSVPTG
jgi:acyl carrier protein